MIGRAIALKLLSQGIAVKVHGRSRPALESIFPLNSYEPHLLEYAVADFASLDEYEAAQLCKGCRQIVHCAGLVHLSESDETLYDKFNVQATQLLAKASKSAKCEQFIFFSSSSVYGNKETNMISETDKLDADTPYAKSKLQSEEYLKNSPPADSTVVLRPSLAFGRGDRGNMLSLIRQILSGKYFLIGDGNAQKSMIFADDLADALYLVTSNPPGGFSIFNLANPKPTSVKELSEAVLQAAGRPANLLSVPSWTIKLCASLANAILGKRSPLSADRLAKLTRHNSISVEKFEKRFSFEPKTDLKSALKAEIEWALSKGKL